MRENSEGSIEEAKVMRRFLGCIVVAGFVSCIAFGTEGLGQTNIPRTGMANPSELTIAARSLLSDQHPGIIAIVGDDPACVPAVIELAKSYPWTIYFQSSSRQIVHQLRLLAHDAGLLGKQVFATEGSFESIYLTDNLLDGAIVLPNSQHAVTETELLRVLHPQAAALVGGKLVGEKLVNGKRLVKEIPEGFDDWSHPYHAPDNNPQSNDQFVRGEFATQFIGYPKFSPMPEQSVVAGGRIFKAMGHIAHKANQNEMLNTLLCINAYNGSILWRRPLSEGFMLHRNTMIGTSDALYLGDHEACKVIDAATGETRQSFTIPPDLTDGPVWKWMGLEGDVLYALVGNLEVKIETLRSNRPGIGHWPWGMWEGHDYKDLRTAFGHGRTLVAVDRHTGKLLWHYRDDEFLDARAMCMKQGRIYAYCAEKFLLCLDASTGTVLWRNSDKDLLEAVGPNEKAQHYITGYATTCYLKCNDDYLFFSGPQRKRMVVASTLDGSLQWTNEVGNLQLVLRPEAIYAAGPQQTRGMLLDYRTGNELASLPARRACTRATGCADSIFFRATGGTVRVMVENQHAEHIAPMRPPCQDGVLVANGHLYWGPWMCGCQLSLYGNIGLRPRGKEKPQAKADGDLASVAAGSLQVFSTGEPPKIDAQSADWLTYRGDPARTDSSSVALLGSPQSRWQVSVSKTELPTAPIAAGELVFIGDRSGMVQAFQRDGKPVWKESTSGAIFYPPTLYENRLLVGSADGYVYAYAAATGELLWRFRVAPIDERIAVFGKIVSRWPVAGGIVVAGDRVYAAAGIAHYDGTYVVALDARTGKLLARNADSGKMSDVVNSGVSMQGELAIKNSELQFPGGGIYEVARYDLADLKCLNPARHQLSSEFRTAFYSWYPEYDRFVSLDHVFPDRRVLSYDANYDGTEFGQLGLETPRDPDDAGRSKRDLAGEFLKRRGLLPPAKHVWVQQAKNRFTGFAVCANALLACGHSEQDPEQAYLSAMEIESGKELWKIPLASNSVRGGLAVNAAGRVFVSLENGDLCCFETNLVK
jgi:outer membrane protein assembly factor BamB